MLGEPLRSRKHHILRQARPAEGHYHCLYKNESKDWECTSGHLPCVCAKPWNGVPAFSNGKEYICSKLTLRLHFGAGCGGYTFNSNTPIRGKWIWVQDQPALQSKFQDNWAIQRNPVSTLPLPPILYFCRETLLHWALFSGHYPCLSRVKSLFRL